MINFLTPKSDKNFDIKESMAGFVKSYYDHRKTIGKVDDSWQETLDNNSNIGSSNAIDEDEIIQKFTQDIVRSYSTLTAGNVIAFTYTSLKGIKKSYFAVIVATKRGNGQYSNIKTKHTLMTSFLIDSGTDLNTLGIVMDVIHSNKIKQKRKSYMGLVKEKQNRALRRATGISKEGLSALFSKAKFRTFCIDVGMQSVYKVDLDG